MVNQDLTVKITKDNVLEELSKEDVIVNSYIFFTKSKKKWKLKKSITVELSDGTVITIPEGYIWDLASVPKWLWGIVRPYNDGLFGTLIHDYMYVMKIGTVQQANKEYLFWNNLTNKNKIDNYIRYIFVTLFGWLVWYDVFKIK
jgi:hypothetical protein